MIIMPTPQKRAKLVSSGVQRSTVRSGNRRRHIDQTKQRNPAWWKERVCLRHTQTYTCMLHRVCDINFWKQPWTCTHVQSTCERKHACEDPCPWGVFQTHKTALHTYTAEFYTKAFFTRNIDPLRQDRGQFSKVQSDELGPAPGWFEHSKGIYRPSYIVIADASPSLRAFAHWICYTIVCYILLHVRL